jgi:hypothetical protein
MPSTDQRIQEIIARKKLKLKRNNGSKISRLKSRRQRTPHPFWNEIVLVHAYGGPYQTACGITLRRPEKIAPRAFRETGGTSQRHPCESVCLENFKLRYHPARVPQTRAAAYGPPLARGRRRELLRRGEFRLALVAAAKDQYPADQRQHREHQQAGRPPIQQNALTARWGPPFGRAARLRETCTKIRNS